MKRMRGTLFIFSAFILWLYTAIVISAEKHAAVIIDIYGTQQISVDKILKKYHKELQMYADLKEKSDESLNINVIKDKKQLKAAYIKTYLIEEKIKHDIKSEGNFAYVQPSLVRYSNGKAYLTIDVVEKNDHKRLSRLLPNPSGNIHDPNHLIRDWIIYENKSIEIENAGKLHRPQFCPAWHCIWGYEHPALKKYGVKFAKSVPKNRDHLISVLKNDKNPQKRAASAYLLAHIKNGHDLVKILSPFMFDPDPVVRNNVMRVIASTVGKISVDTLSLKKVILATTLPTTTDRNKSLYILLALLQTLKKDKNIKIVRQKMLPSLLIMLQQQQPVTHLPAWKILKKISGKNIGERDYNAWKIWAAEHPE